MVRAEAPLLDELLYRYDPMWLWPSIGALLALGTATLGVVFGGLRWRVPAPWYLLGVALSVLVAQGVALWVASSAENVAAVHGRVLLLDGVGLLWAVLGIALAQGAVALAQLIGVDERARWSVGRALVTGAYGVVSALLLGVQGWAHAIGPVGAAWALWFLWVGGAFFLGNLRHDPTARHGAGRVLLGFLAVAGTLILAAATDHLVQGLVWSTFAEVSEARGRVLLVDHAFAFSNVRRMGFVAVGLSAMGGAAGLYRGLQLASDGRGTFSALVAVGGMSVFVATELALLGLLRAS